MMISALFLTYLFIHAVLLALSFRIEGASARIWVVRALLVGMLWDNAMLALSPWVIDAGWYPAANLPRYAMHALFLPFLAWFGWSAMRAAGVKPAAGRWVDRTGYFTFWNGLSAAIPGIRYRNRFQQGGCIRVNRIIKNRF